MAAARSNDLFSSVFRVRGGIFCPFRSGQTASGETGSVALCGAATATVAIKQVISKLSKSIAKKEFSRRMLPFIKILPFRKNLIFYYTREAVLRTAEDYEPVPAMTTSNNSVCHSFFFCPAPAGGWRPEQDMIQY
jgi:hypothetical protein